MSIDPACELSKHLSRGAENTSMHLHLSADPEADAHLLNLRGSCAFHPDCLVSAADLPSSDGIRVVIAARDGVRVNGLPETLFEDEVCMVLDRPLDPDEIEGPASAISLDATLLPATAPDLSDRIIRTSERPLSAFLINLIRQIAEMPPHTSRAGTRTMARSLLGVLSAIYVEKTTRESITVSRSPADELYIRALAVIRARISDPELSPTLIAEQCAVTPRYLHMVFGKHDETASARILRDRLEHSRADLADPALSEMSIAEISARWGFSTPSHFSQRFRERFGTSPRQWRRNASSAP